jgi:hypothetical protein
MKKLKSPEFDLPEPYHSQSWEWQAFTHNPDKLVEAFRKLERYAEQSDKFIRHLMTWIYDLYTFLQYPEFVKLRFHEMPNIDNPEEGDVYYDSDDSKLKVYTGNDFEICNIIKETGLVTVIGNSITFDSDIVLLIGADGTEGSWRSTVSDPDLVFERYESGSWVEKGSFVP